jgi:hypothetical protein
MQLQALSFEGVLLMRKSGRNSSEVQKECKGTERTVRANSKKDRRLALLVWQRRILQINQWPMRLAHPNPFKVIDRQIVIGIKRLFPDCEK